MTFLDELMKEAKEAREASARVVGVATKGQEKIELATERHLKQVETATKQQDVELRGANEAIDNIQRNTRLPPIMRGVANLFDSAFSNTAQRAELQRRQLRSDAITRQVDISQRVLTNEIATEERRLAVSKEGLAKETFDLQTAMEMYGVHVRERQEKRAERAAGRAGEAHRLSMFRGTRAEERAERAEGRAVEAHELGMFRGERAESRAQRAEVRTELAEGRATEAHSLAMSRGALALESQIDARQFEKIENKIKKYSIQDLMDMKQGRKKMDPLLATVPGVLDAAILKRRGDEAQMDAAELQLAAEETRQTTLQRQQVLQTREIDELADIAKDPNNELGVTTQLVKEEAIRRDNQQVAMESAQLALEAGRTDMAVSQTNRYLANATEAELTQHLENSLQPDSTGTPAGMTTIAGAITVTTRQLQNALGAVRAEQKQSTQTVLETAINRMESSPERTRLNNQVQGFSQIMNPGSNLENAEDAFAALPADVQADLDTLKSQLEVLELMQDAGVDTGLKQTEILKEANALMKTRIDEELERYSKNSRPAIESYMQTGRVTSQESASSLLIEEGLNPSSLAYDPILGQAYANFAEALSTEAAQASKTEVFFSDESVGQTKTDVEVNSAIVQNALRNSGFVQDVTDPLVQDILQQSFLELMNEIQVEGSSPYAGFVDPATGQFTAAVLDQAGQLNAGSLGVLISARTIKLQEDGIIDPAGDLMTAVMDRARNKLTSLTSDYFQNDPLKAAIAKVAFNNQPALAIATRLGQVHQVASSGEKVAVDERGRIREHAEMQGRFAAGVQGAGGVQGARTLSEFMQRGEVGEEVLEMPIPGMPTGGTPLMKELEKLFSPDPNTLRGSRFR